MKRIFSKAASVLKYILALFMMYAGIATAFGPIEPYDGRLGWVYSSRISLILFGIVFFLSGATLLYGKLFKKNQFVGHGLMAIYLCLLFAGMLNSFALGWDGGIANFIASGIVGALYLRWKHNLWYGNTTHQRQADIQDQYDDPTLL